MVPVNILINIGVLEPSYNDLKTHSPKPQLLLHQPNNWKILKIGDAAVK